MNIIINASSIYKGGAEQVVHSFVNECKKISGNYYHVLLCDNIYKIIDTYNFPKNFYFYRLNKRPASGYLNLIKTIQYFKKLEKEIKPDVVISTGGHGYWRPKAPIVTGFNIPHYIYIDSPYFNNISIVKYIYWNLKKIFDMYFYRYSDAIVVQTEDVKKRLNKLLPSAKIFTISNTVNGSFIDRKEFDKKLPQKMENEIRLITISANYPHKNLKIIKSVLEELFSKGIHNIRFVLTLPQEAFIQDFGNVRYRENIINVGPVPIDECPSLYEECDIMFLPTLLECFSASYAEAMAMKMPILTSDLSFSHTVCKDAAIYFNPISSKDIAEKIMKVVQDPILQKKLIDAGERVFMTFNTPNERASRFLDIANSLIDS